LSKELFTIMSWLCRKQTLPLHRASSNKLTTNWNYGTVGYSSLNLKN